MKLPHTSKRPDQVEIKKAIIQVRTLLYIRTTRYSIRNVNDILWSFPEKLSEKRNRGDGWKWSQVKKNITDFMNSPKMQKEWRLSSGTHEGRLSSGPGSPRPRQRQQQQLKR